MVHTLWLCETPNNLTHEHISWIIYVQFSSRGAFHIYIYYLFKFNLSYVPMSSSSNFNVIASREKIYCKYLSLLRTYSISFSSFYKFGIQYKYTYFDLGFGVLDCMGLSVSLLRITSR